MWIKAAFCVTYECEKVPWPVINILITGIVMGCGWRRTASQVTRKPNSPKGQTRAWKTVYNFNCVTPTVFATSHERQRHPSHPTPPVLSEASTPLATSHSSASKKPTKILPSGTEGNVKSAANTCNYHTKLCPKVWKATVAYQACANYLQPGPHLYQQVVVASYFGQRQSSTTEAIRLRVAPALGCTYYSLVCPDFDFHAFKEISLAESLVVAFLPLKLPVFAFSSALGKTMWCFFPTRNWLFDVDNWDWTSSESLSIQQIWHHARWCEHVTWNMFEATGCWCDQWW